MRSRPPGPAGTSRRSFLRGALGIAGVGLVGTAGLGSVAGCEAFAGAPEPQPHPLEGFIADTLALADRYGATIAAIPDLATMLTPIRDAHLAHAEALAAATGVELPAASDPGGSVPSAPQLALRALATAEAEARDAAVTECLAAGSWIAPLLGAIAAARSCHLEVMRP